MFIRFEVAEKDEVSGREKGLFSAMTDLLDKNELFEYEIAQELEIYNWFKKNLRPPPAQTAARGPKAKPRSISWFKSSAQEHIDKMRSYAQILESHDVLVNQINSDRPGKIVYEDEFQVAAIPYNDTFK